jgi:hypothetical protein
VSKAKEQMQDEKNLRDVVLGQIENSVLESDRVLLREEVAKHNYDLVHKAPLDIQYLQDALEKIEVAFPLGKGRGSSKNNGKGNQMTTMSDKIPKKKSHAAKHEKPSVRSCALCKKHGGAHKTHNTIDCKKYDHQGNLKKGFVGKRDTPPGTNKSYAQLFAETEKLKASCKKKKKALKKNAKKNKSVSMLTAMRVRAATTTTNEGVGRVATGG